MNIQTPTSTQNEQIIPAAVGLSINAFQSRSHLPQATLSSHNERTQSSIGSSSSLFQNQTQFSSKNHLPNNSQTVQVGQINSAPRVSSNTSYQTPQHQQYIGQVPTSIPAARNQQFMWENYTNPYINQHASTSSKGSYPPMQNNQPFSRVQEQGIQHSIPAAGPKPRNLTDNYSSIVTSTVSLQNNFQRTNQVPNIPPNATIPPAMVSICIQY